MTTYRILAASAVLASAMASASSGWAQTAPEAGLRGAYSADVNGNTSGGFDRDVTGTQRLDVGYTADLGGGWSLTGTVSGTTGRSLSTEAIGDVQGVQGVYAGGDALWLYELALTRTFDAGQIRLGRLSSGDAFGSVDGMGEFVNSAFSSNGGAISINDPGRTPSPASSWAVTGAFRPSERLTFSGGAFLSDPRRASVDRPADLSFRPGDGVLAFAQADAQPVDDVHVGLGVWADSARFDTFAGETRRGNQGAYAYVQGRLAGEAEGRRLEGFAMVQIAPRRDRSLEPLSVFAGVSLHEPFEGRSADTLNLGVSSGRFSGQSGLSGSETTLEANYRYALTDRIALRPDVQFVINPGGVYDDALVLGVQLEAGF